MNDSTYYLMIVIFAVLFLYFFGRYYLREGFEGKTCKDILEYVPPEEIADSLMPDRPYSTNPIMNLDDYELTAVFKNEGSREAGKREISDAMSRYPLSWTNRPPSDQKFQQYREAFIDASEKSKPVNTSGFDSISGDDMTPPDNAKIDEEEKKLLAMYNPEKPQELKNYSVDNVISFVKNIYKRRGLVADVEQSKQGGDNIFEVVETHPVNEKIVWEDEVDENMSPVERYNLRGEQQIVVPQTASDIAAGLDPFFEPRTKVRMDRHDYTKFTPGLERQFAPTYAMNAWY
jgi:hypothetical protein